MTILTVATLYGIFTILRFLTMSKFIKSKIKNPELYDKRMRIITEITGVGMWLTFIIFGDPEGRWVYISIFALGLYGLFGSHRQDKLKEVRAKYSALIMRHNQALIEAAATMSGHPQESFETVENAARFIESMGLTVNKDRIDTAIYEDIQAGEYKYRDIDLQDTIFGKKRIGYNQIDFNNRYLWNPLLWFKPAVKCLNDQDAVKKLDVFEENARKYSKN